VIWARACREGKRLLCCSAAAQRIDIADDRLEKDLRRASHSCDTYQRALDKIAAAAAKRGIAAGMYFIPPEMDPNFFVQKGFKFFTMPWGPWAKAGIQNGLSGIKR
jgi:hypothetical protein